MFWGSQQYPVDILAIEIGVLLLFNTIKISISLRSNSWISMVLPQGCIFACFEVLSYFCHRSFEKLTRLTVKQQSLGPCPWSSNSSVRVQSWNEYSARNIKAWYTSLYLLGEGLGIRQDFRTLTELDCVITPTPLLVPDFYPDFLQVMSARPGESLLRKANSRIDTLTAWWSDKLWKRSIMLMSSINQMCVCVFCN